MARKPWNESCDTLCQQPPLLRCLVTCPGTRQGHHGLRSHAPASRPFIAPWAGPDKPRSHSLQGTGPDRPGILDGRPCMQLHEEPTNLGIAPAHSQDAELSTTPPGRGDRQTTLWPWESIHTSTRHCRGAGTVHPTGMLDQRKQRSVMCPWGQSKIQDLAQARPPTGKG